MSFDLTGRVAIVTGGGQGIGRAAALTLARLGAAVTVNDIGCDESGQATAEQVAHEIRTAGGRAIADTASILDDEAVGRLASRTEEEFGSLDILINNAGLSWQGKLWECDAETFERVSSAHLRGAFHCTRHAVLRMKERGFGRIVNLVSRAGIVGMPNTIPYAVGKGGLLGLTNAASRELGPLGITVNAVNPGSTLTPMFVAGTAGFDALGEERRRAAARARESAQKPEQVAIVIASLCAEEAAHINGQVFLVERNRVGLYQPLTLDQEFERSDDADVFDMMAGLCKFQFHELADPYA